jgi:hypothetical protein
VTVPLSRIMGETKAPWEGDAVDAYLGSTTNHRRLDDRHAVAVDLKIETLDRRRQTYRQREGLWCYGLPGKRWKGIRSYLQSQQAKRPSAKTRHTRVTRVFMGFLAFVGLSAPGTCLWCESHCIRKRLDLHQVSGESWGWSYGGFCTRSPDQVTASLMFLTATALVPPGNAIGN